MRDLRKQRGLTQSELASLCKMPQSYVSKLERGKRSLYMHEVFAYADALKMDPNVLFKKLVHHIASQASKNEQSNANANKGASFESR